MRDPRTNFSSKAQAVAEVVRLRRLLAESEQVSAKLLTALRPLMAQVQAEVNYYRNQYPDAEGADHPVVQDGTQALNAAHAAIAAATEDR